MISTNWTFLFTWAWWELILCKSRNIFSIELFLVAFVTKMCVTPAKPLGYLTTEFTFISYKLFSMSLAIIYKGRWATRWAY